MTLPTTDAETLAIDFLMEDLDIPAADRNFFYIISTRDTGENWYVVEIGVEGLPDKWALQIFDTGQCDPCYTFTSPMPAGEDVDLAEFPTRIAEVIAKERAGGMI
ncbi:hypothetical protein CKA32_006230 [Geitlerinema sp. FC II]|nr:hypothetical protein CKA32_006230 [Geitlerinema sp. FC II]